ncbi:hypothetical protein [Mucilaginibacter sp. SJ]|uniref:hypothetical protein n=1 Tax=Mucilaginibacter sp. SJ TaxID=3029053 RepID=UPI0023A93764|nr:hypothetical protein [Mucilaginibacter sp. SJ]WEA00531.1 hypothetical protein MusilaSJ_24025 [Mucilaginibacter sp. SJ]
MLTKVVFYIIGLIFLTNIVVCHAQKRNNQKSLPKHPIVNGLLYVWDSKSKDYLLPYIEQKLKNLRYPGKPQKLFDSVASLNTLTQSSSIEGSIISSLIENQAIKDPGIVGPQKVQEYKNYLSYINIFQSVLLIKTNEFRNLIEFQFTLYKEFKLNEGLTYNTSASVFIDPQKPHYQADIIRSLQQVFVQAATLPQFTMKSNCMKVDERYYLSTKDSIVFEPLVTDDNPEDDRIYFWSQKNKDSSDYISLSKSAKKQILRNLNKGDYTLMFSLTDGISNSKEEAFHISVYVPPKIHAKYGDGDYYYPGDNQLIVQRYLSTRYRVRLASRMKIFVNPADFEGDVNLSYNIIDENGKATFQNKTVPLPNAGQIDMDNFFMVHPLTNNEYYTIGRLRSGNYSFAFQAFDKRIKSDTFIQELSVIQKRPIGFIVDEFIAPVKSGRPFNSPFNLSFGINLKLDKAISMTVTEGSNLTGTTGNSPFSRYYSNILLNFIEQNDNYGIGAGVIFPTTRIPNFGTAIGGKIFVKLLSRYHGDFGVGLSYYSNLEHERIFGLHVYQIFSL